MVFLTSILFRAKVGFAAWNSGELVWKSAHVQNSVLRVPRVCGVQLAAFFFVFHGAFATHPLDGLTLLQRFSSNFRKTSTALKDPPAVNAAGGPEARNAGVGIIAEALLFLGGSSSVFFFSASLHKNSPAPQLRGADGSSGEHTCRTVDLFKDLSSCFSFLGLLHFL